VADVRALVTGGGQGIGAATVRRLAADGFDIAVHAHRHVAEAETVAAEARSAGRDAFVLPGDLATPAGVRDVVDAITKKWDSLDVLVNNAGVYDRGPFLAITDDDLLDCFRVNLFAPFSVTRELVPLLRRSPSGRVVFVSSLLAFNGAAAGAHYAAAKAGLLGLARSIAKELAPGITVNTVVPGPVDTAILAEDTPARRAERQRQIPLGRIGEPADVANAIAFLVSPGASFLTGTTVHVNGGQRSD
jgi:3-oxoacyl-[acyl-carrier protein] reductase